MIPNNPHSFDTRGFLFGMKCLAIFLILGSIVRYGAVFAGERIAAPAHLNVAAAATTEEPHETPASALGLPHIAINAPPPRVSAAAFLIGDIESAAVYASKDSDSPHPIASISKLLVALVARDTIAASSTITITAADRRETEGSPGKLRQGDAFIASDLYYPLLMESNNSVAYALARAGGGNEFIRKMLRLAHAIGMDDTLLDDSSGLSENNSASAADLFALTRYIFKNDPGLFAITKTPRYTLRSTEGRAYPLANFNVFAGREGFLGGKTGYTDEAKETMIALFEVPVSSSSKAELATGQAKATIAIIVLGSADRKKDVEKLLAWFKGAAQAE